MKSLNRLFLLAAQFEQKLQKYSQSMDAQPEDIERALDAARLFKPADVQAEISPLLDQQAIPASTTVTIHVQFDSRHKPTYVVSLDPMDNNKAAGLKKALEKHFAPRMINAIKQLKITNTMEIKWQLFQGQ